MRNLAVAAFSAIILSGCGTSLTAKRQEPGQVHVGQPYELHFDQFEGKLVYRLEDCEELKLAVSASIDKQVSSPDPKHRYYLNASDLAGVLKSADVAVEYHPNGSIKSLNAAAEDKTVEVIASVVETAIGIATLASATGDASTKKDAVHGICNGDASRALVAYKDAIGELEAATAAKKAAQLQFDALKKKVADLGDVVDEATKTQYRVAFDLLSLRTDELRAANAKVKKEVKAVSYVVPFRLPNNGGELEGTLVKFDKASYKKEIWDRWAKDDIDGEPWKSLNAEWRIRPDQERNLPTLDPEKSFEGIPFRNPAPGRFEIRKCVQFEEDNSQVCDKVLVAKRAKMAQLGRLFLLECKSPAFTSMGCSLGFDDKGNLISAGAKRTSATGEKMASAAADVVGQISGAKQKRLEREKAILELEAEIDDLRDAGDDASDEIAVSEAEAEILIGEKAIEDAAATAE